MRLPLPAISAAQGEKILVQLSDARLFFPACNHDVRIGVKLAHRSYLKFKRIERLKVRQIEICKHLDSKIPSMFYGNFDDLECQHHEGELCCVCLDELEGTLVRKLHCSHILHKDCLDRWCLHLSDINCKQAREQKKPKESLWVCPLCKHPAIADLEQPDPISRAISTGSAQSQLLSQASDGPLVYACPQAD